MQPDSASHRLAVLGAGVMGSSITAMALGHGVPVVLVDIDDGALDRARASIAQQVRHAQLMGAAPADRPTGELVTSQRIEDIADATAVVEAITEKPDLKSDVHAKIGAAVRRGTPVISNTSGIPIDEMASALPCPEDLIGTHFMNPAYLIRTVEVIVGPRTAERTVAALMSLLSALDRQPIVVNDSPGFVTSRLLHPMINDAARLVDEGVATAADVDALMLGCLGHATGPLRTADMIGLDNLVDALDVLHERTGNPTHEPCALLRRKVAQGDHGIKTGRGFHEYERQPE
ncbi:3-hydroxyacyl-CoA dehydrogenase family protein [Kibdelosporangium phytohabitans]|uniref:3-hydroxyacyl-CoA dehydrogenase n=1 Tax=Kibdelosporangium phytohabitans TaxID=860235 RepID=A0A0N9I7G1_9PSEU|nr:3-hydroxyacyl-CoA dehydrogenase family protein [Kibdelosporangium phytohabitans]ALG12166.1 3-hydroxyacyl-CoA dehydrogenase [Kibdelosporangium phytohabitans]MBE1463690.1 methoxymalonate biosynthesis protein [Kibdelosporangium phytohabitans]